MQQHVLVLRARRARFADRLYRAASIDRRGFPPTYAFALPPRLMNNERLPAALRRNVHRASRRRPGRENVPPSALRRREHSPRQSFDARYRHEYERGL
jgi:hypothetical protein